VSTKVGVGIMSALLLLYLAAVAQLAISLIIAGDLLAKGIGIALLVLPLIGAWAMAAELAFGLRSQRLADRLHGEGALPVDDLPKRSSGRTDRAAADAQFPGYRSEVEGNPDDWRAWFRLGLAYDASGDRRRARQSIRRAISLERRGPA
jgi:cytochrome c-type biogenesis protein CcmH/NrfG